MMPVKSTVNVKSSSERPLSNGLKAVSSVFRSKMFIIAVIAVVAVIGLALLLLNADKLVGRAYTLQPSKTLVVTQITPSCTAAPAGLLHWWRGESTPEDSVGGLNLNYYGGDVGYVAGKVGNAFYFSGTNSIAYPVGGSIDSASLADQISVEMWVRPNSNLGDIRPFMNVGDFKFMVQHDDLQNNNKVELKASFTDGTVISVLSENPLPLNVWTHVVGIFDGNSVKLYINGIRQNSNLMYLNGKKASVTGTPNIRRNNPISLIDEVSIYNTDISAYVAKLYNAGSYGKCVPQIVCGNGVKEGNEQCDGSVPFGASCQVLTGSPGILSCGQNCNLDTSQCGVQQDTDGDGVADNLEPVNCLGVAGNVYSSGTLAGCLVGDVTSDGCVGLPDIADIGPNVDLSCVSGGKTAEQGDINGDGCVNLVDIAQIGPNVDLQCGG
ncbi:MAG: LamG domain-containing protein [Nanoarchaeota archaeon]